MALQRLLSHVFFDRAPPKSLDRLALTRRRSRIIARRRRGDAYRLHRGGGGAGLEIAGYEPARLIVCGGGRHNLALMEALQKQTGVVVQNCDALGWAGDALEAEAFAWLAVRHCLGLPQGVPQTTGVSGPIVGGRKYNPVTTEGPVSRSRKCAGRDIALASFQARAYPCRKNDWHF